MKKHWIYLKRGLSQDPKHRERMGNRIWLFMHILDRADWETGIVHDWRDREEALDMEMPWRTLQEQRQELAELGYITCRQKIRGQEIIIHHWTNPRNYSGEIMNIPDGYGDFRTMPGKGTGQGTGQGSSNSRTPTYRSKIKDQNGAGKPRPAPAPSKTRKRDPLFDAIAEVCKVDPATSGATIGKVAAALRQAAPPYTESDVRAFAAWWWGDEWRAKRRTPPTVWQLQERIGIVRQPAQPEAVYSARALAAQRELDARPR